MESKKWHFQNTVEDLWAVEEKIKNPQDVVKFDAEGYIYDPKRSTPEEPVFHLPKDFSIAGRWKKT